MWASRAKLCDDLLVTIIMKCSLTTGSQCWISCITLDQKEYMLLVKIDWTVLRGCPLDANKDLMKNGWGTTDQLCDNNSRIMPVKWVDNSMVNLTSNFVGSEPIREVERWCGKEMVRKSIAFTKIVQQYIKNVGGVNLVGMLLSLYRIPCKTKRRCHNIFLHLIDMAKINAWIL